MAVDYSSHYYESVSASATQSIGEIAPIVLQFVSPRSVVDLGCATGAWLAEFKRRGSDDILGIDGPWVGLDQLQIPADRFRVADLGEPVASDRRFDLAMCVEVAEHLPESRSETIVESLVSLSDVVLFSAAIPHQGGENHFNEQWPDYWSQKFERRGYSVLDCLRHLIWANPKVEYWYAQNLLLFANEKAMASNPALRQAALATRRTQLSLVHPRAFLEGTVRAKGPSQLFQCFLGSVRRRLRPRPVPSR